MSEQQQLVPSGAGGKAPLTDAQRAAKRAEIEERVAIARQRKAEEDEIARRQKAEEDEIARQRKAEEDAGIEMACSFFEAVADSFAPPKNPLTMPPRVKKAIRRQLKQLFEREYASFEEFCKQMKKDYIDLQSEYDESPGDWQHLVSCWDFQPEHLWAIKQWYDSLPKGTVLLDPCAGKGFLAACLQKSGITVVTNDFEEQEFSFSSCETSRLDGRTFVLNFIAKNPGVPVAVLISWAPQEGHSGSDLSRGLFQLANEIDTVQGVIHISEGRIDRRPGGMIGCTDTEEALQYKEANFTDVVFMEREYPPQWRIGALMPIKDALSIAVPNRRCSRQ
jgi:hypothetical protein